MRINLWKQFTDNPCEETGAALKNLFINDETIGLMGLNQENYEDLLRIILENRDDIRVEIGETPARVVTELFKSAKIQKKRKAETARQMIGEGLADDMISRFTGLPEEVVRSLR
jgi:hypothetical protein